jgi:prepilin-type N-terminal cleavage/methylation domain-containing protein
MQKYSLKRLNSKEFLKIKNQNRGFTLIELLVVISIIAILAAIILINLSAGRAKARDARRMSDLDSLSKAVEMYQDEKQSYPVNTTSGGITSATWTTSNFGTGATWDALIWQGITPAMPKDPKNVAPSVYYYRTDTNGTVYELNAVLEKNCNAMVNDGGDDNAANCAASARYEIGNDPGLNLL